MIKLNLDKEANKTVVFFVKFLIRLFLFVSACVPLALYRFFFSFFLFSKFIKLTKEGRRLFSNIEKVFDLPGHSDFSKIFARQNLSSLFLMTIETVKEFVFFDKVNVEGLDDLRINMQKAESMGSKGQILITGHLGAWELLGKFCGQSTDKNFYALAKPSVYNIVNILLEILRKRFRVLVLWTGKSNFQRQIIRVLNSKDWVAFLMDQKPEKRRGPTVEFLGQKTEFVAGPATLALKYNCPVVLAFCLRKDSFHYVLKSKILNKKECVDQKDIKELTQKFATEIEEIIHQYPEQWTWSYKRWKN